MFLLLKWISCYKCCNKLGKVGPINPECYSVCNKLPKVLKKSMSQTSPILLNIPTEIKTQRLLLRAPRQGDGLVVNAAIKESFDRLHIWMPWAKTLPTPDETEENLRRSTAQWILREELRLLVFNRSGTELIGSSGLHLIDWSIPKFEVGAWIRTPYEGKGLMSEALNAITRFAFTELNAKRVDGACDPKNERSRKMIERLGFLYESEIKRREDVLRLYFRSDIDGLPKLEVSW